MGRKTEKPASRDAVLHVAFVEALFQKNMSSLTRGENPAIGVGDPAFFIYENMEGEYVAGNVIEGASSPESFVRGIAKHFGNTKVHHTVSTPEGRRARRPKYEKIPVHTVSRMVGWVTYEQARSGEGTLTGKIFTLNAVRRELEAMTSRREAQENNIVPHSFADRERKAKHETQIKKAERIIRSSGPL